VSLDESLSRLEHITPKSLINKIGEGIFIPESDQRVWRLGLCATKDPAHIMTDIYRALRSLNIVLGVGKVI
jgi:hypothetical protein